MKKFKFYSAFFFNSIVFGTTKFFGQHRKYISKYVAKENVAK